MQNAGLDKSQAGIKVSGWNISNLRNADGTTPAAENEEELRSLFMRMKEESEKAGLKFNTQKTRIMASCPITSSKIHRENVKAVTDFIFLGSKIAADGDCTPGIKRHFLLWRKL